jgi:hypothetical protein
MNKRPRSPDDLPASNGHTGPAAAARPPADDRRDALPALLASRWAVILKRFRDYMHQR